MCVYNRSCIQEIIVFLIHTYIDTCIQYSILFTFISNQNLQPSRFNQFKMCWNPFKKKNIYTHIFRKTKYVQVQGWEYFGKFWHKGIYTWTLRDRFRYTARQPTLRNPIFTGLLRFYFPFSVTHYSNINIS